MASVSSSAGGRPINWKLNLFVIWLSQILAHCAMSFALPFIPLYMRYRFNLDDEAQRGFYVSLFQFFGMMTFCVSNPIWGALGDRFGRKIMLLRAYFLNGFTIPLMVVAPTVGWLIAVRAFVNLFSGTISASQALVVTTTPEDKHGFALGTLSTARWSGTVFGLLGGGLVVHFFSYRAAFIICGAMLLACGLITLLFARENFVPPRRREAVPEAAQHPIRMRGVFNAAIVSLMALVCLLATARQMDTPFLPMLVEIIGGEKNAELYTSYISALAAAGGILSGLFFGALSDRLPPWKLAVPALAFAGASMLCQSQAQSLWVLALCRFLCFFAAGGIEPVVLSQLSKITPPEHRGVVLGWNGSIRVLGNLCGAGAAGFVVTRFGTRGVFLTAGIVMLTLIPATLAIFNPRRSPR
ncbi:MAG: MFS transporter [Lentisphaeria bacterium]|nr:MFS transporter [Lentisphaeria bacterium]